MAHNFDRETRRARWERRLAEGLGAAGGTGAQSAADCGLTAEQVRKLESNGICTWGDIAWCSLGRPDEMYGRKLLDLLLGEREAERLIALAWGIDGPVPDRIERPDGVPGFDRNAEKSYERIMDLSPEPENMV